MGNITNMVKNFILILVFILSACTTSPMGRGQLVLLPDSELDKMGIQGFNQLKEKEQPLKSTQTNQYVRCIVDHILQANGINGSWEVAVFNDKETINAFAMPGKKIGVYTGILKVANTPDKLAAVIGHEIGHVLAKHANERMSQQMIVNLGLQAAGTFADLPPAALQALGFGAEVGITLPFSRTHEAEADLIGLKLMAKAGFNPEEAVRLWEAMAKATQAAGAKPPPFLSTHPSDRARIKKIQSFLPEVLPLYEEARRAGRTPRCKP